MNKTLVAYFTRTGNTRALAEAIFNALDGEKDIQPIDQVASFDAYDFVFIGFPVQMHSVPYPVEQFIKTIPPRKKIAFFCTHGSLPGHRLSREAIEYAVVLAPQAKVLGTFCTRGRLSIQALDTLGKSPEHQEWTEMGASAGTHPDAGDLEEARIFARQMKLLALNAGR
jgi:flavodoxin